MKYLRRLKRRNADAFAKAAHECFDEDDSFLILLEQMPFGGVEEFFSIRELSQDSNIFRMRTMRKNDKYAGYVVCRIKLKDGKIASMDEHWADDGEAPKWRQDMKIGRKIK